MKILWSPFFCRTTIEIMDVRVHIILNVILNTKGEKGGWGQSLGYMLKSRFFLAPSLREFSVEQTLPE